MENIEIELSRIFVKVVQHGGFSKAADALRMPKSSVSKAITRLEKMTNTKLLLRTTRSHTLTDSGRLFYDACIEPIQRLEDAQKSLYGSDSIVSGTVRITAPEDFGTYIIAPIIGKVMTKHPNLNFDLQCSNDLVDLVKSGFDIAVRIGTLRESGLKARYIGSMNLILVAAPCYLTKSPPLGVLSDLINHNCLTISDFATRKNWELQDSGGNMVNVSINVKMESNQMTSLLYAAIAGAGVFLVPNYLCEDHIASGKLVRVLDNWKSTALPVSLVSPVSMSSTARLSTVAEMLISNIRQKIDL